MAKMLSPEPTVHANVRMRDTTLGEWTEIGEGCSLGETTIGDYTYMAGDVECMYSTIGKCCSIASRVRINPGNHPWWRVIQHHMTYRRQMYDLGEDDAQFFEWRRSHLVHIGHDV